MFTNIPDMSQFLSIYRTNSCCHGIYMKYHMLVQDFHALMCKLLSLDDSFRLILCLLHRQRGLTGGL